MRSCLQTQTGRVSTQRSTAGVAPRRAGGRARLLALQMSALACGAPQAQRPPAYSLAPARQGLPPKKSCRVAAAASQSSQDEELMEVELDISVKGMMCDGCSSRVEEVLSKEKGVSRVEVSLEKALATVEVKVPSHTDAFNMLPKLVETVKELGFEAEPVIDGLA